ncbi:signal peptidase II [Actinocatenispora rupis]|uniref:signal peptidase II n=1 Tax=Actinocatenispora rupis TaxID=519421 RepID=UPI003570A2D3
MCELQAVGGTALSHDSTDRAPSDDAARSDHAPRSRRTVALLAGVAAVALALDILTKILAVAKLRPDEPVKLLGGAVYLSLTRNTGAAFNLGAGYTAVLAVVAVVVIVVIIRFARRLGSVPWAVALGLVLGGAAGNLTDRLFRAPAPFRGGVIDFISLFGPDGRPWPIFNVADSCLVCGVILAVLLELTGRKLDGSRANRSAGDETKRADGAGTPDTDAEPSGTGEVEPADTADEPAAERTAGRRSGDS